MNSAARMAVPSRSPGPTSRIFRMKSYNNSDSLLVRPNLLREIDAELATRRLGEFVRQAWVIVEPSTPFVPGWHIDCIIEHLEAVTYGQIRNLLINVPPRHMKSLLVSVFWPAWEWIRWPHRRWLYSSYSGQLSLRDSVHCRRLIESPWYQQHWRDRFALTSDQNTKGRFDNDRSGYRIASSVGGSVTGEGGDRYYALLVSAGGWRTPASVRSLCLPLASSVVRAPVPGCSSGSPR